jgi:hypothetical protein
LGIPLLRIISGSPYLWDMPNTPAPQSTSEEVARRIEINTKSILAEQGRDLDWLASEVGISVFTILKAFRSRVDTWLLFDLSFYLNVSPDRLIEVR